MNKAQEKSKSDKPSKDELATRSYFLPSEGVSVEATTEDEAVEVAKQIKKDEEVGDGIV